MLPHPDQDLPHDLPDASGTSGRGRYDRGASPSARAQRVRERMVLAASQMLALGQSLTVDRVVAAASIGRNTFYGHFDDADDLERACILTAQRQLEERLRQTQPDEGAPYEAIGATATHWFEVAALERVAVCILLERGPVALGDCLWQAFARARGVAARAGVLPREINARLRGCWIAAGLELTQQFVDGADGAASGALLEAITLALLRDVARVAR